MADYIYLMETRLTRAQQETLAIVRSAARSRGMTVFLVGGAVRDLTTGSPVRDLDVAVQGNALKLKKDLAAAGGYLSGELEPMQALFFSFPGGVRLEVSSTLEVSFTKPGKPSAKPANILDDLRRRDFTANAMAISLNDGSYGLLMDPLNGVADIENRELRLVSNYGFIEDPVRMIRATRLSARLGWHMEEKTQKRYDTGKAEGYISALSAAQRGYETEEIFHEEDPLRGLRRLEHEGWTKFLFPAWTASKANETELNRVRDIVGQLGAMGIHPDPSAAYFPLLTAKLAPKDVVTLKKSFVRPGFVSQIASLEAETKGFAVQFTSKAAAAPSEAWKMLMSAVPEQVLSLAATSKSAPVQARFKAFFTEWPQARQRIPYQLMQEMRITPDLPGYDDLLEKLFFALMDAKIDTPEAAKAFLEPYSPPAPPPPINMRRRPVKREVKPVKSRTKKVAAEAAPAASAEDTSSVPSSPMAEEVKKPASVGKAPAKAIAAKPVAKEEKPVVKEPKQPAKGISTPAKVDKKKGTAKSSTVATSKGTGTKTSSSPTKAKVSGSPKSAFAKSSKSASGKSGSSVRTAKVKSNVKASQKKSPAKAAPKKVQSKVAKPAKLAPKRKPEPVKAKSFKATSKGSGKQSPVVKKKVTRK